MARFTAEALKVAYGIQRKIESLQTKLRKQNARLSNILGGEIPIPFKRGGNGISAVGRARIAEAQRRRWAKAKEMGGSGSNMSSSARAKIRAAGKKRWAAAKKAGRNRS